MRSSLLILLALVACGHSEPFVGSSGRAEGPFTPDGQLTVNGTAMLDWAGDGAGILVFTSRPDEKYDLPLLVGRGRKDPLDNCLGLIPRDGGSMTWQFCDRRLSHFRDSNDVFVTASIGPYGELLYVESSQPPDFFFPVATEAELWLGSRHAPYGERRHLLRLYRDDNGHPTVSEDQVNWLTDVQWAGQDAFIARAYYLRPDSLLTPFGIARGVITRDTTTLTILPGTAGIIGFVAAEDGNSIVYARAGRTIVSLPSNGLAERIVATLPSGVISSVSCQQQVCVAVTQDGGSNGIGASTLWRVSLANGQATVLRTFLSVKVPTKVRLSPDGRRVVVQKTDGRLFLLSDLEL
ncbi:MAG: hypothetical protein ABIZ70_01180 [Gemmatimonadales bacterium]